ncbi:metal ABC transporter solute-binding protein, Zn/Mn family [Gaoshiqia sediminis]|uniref:Zinc ABC transporter substrate-binding protein n=1 Tax=Gaoshiqia sediminis TaxID=2986998 RepID=A0AA41YBI3_9BACT|nr:zinc ABC transporter substrate-binding protein [Gaoshiqia sediminis]MCW0481692.1 zinc ABC transporter substrate-binding protein [Gaoshiqia sediminis]
MRKIILFILILGFGCTTPPTTDKPIVAVSILPQKFFVEKIAGNLAEVRVLVPPGASPELYSLMPSQMKDLAAAKLWLRIGKIGFEEGWVEKIQQSSPGLKIVNTSVQADWIAGEEEVHGDHVHLHGIDPHIWVSPGEVRKIVAETYLALVNLFPEQKDLLEANHNRFQHEIDELDTELKSKFDQLPGKKFLIFHPALTYLARDYGLEQIALEVDGKEPSPSHLRSLVELAKAENIRVIFIQKESNADNTRQLAREIGGEVVQVDPLNEAWDQQLREIANKITQATKP